MAVDFYHAGQFKEAVTAYPNFPLAWVGLYETTRADLHKRGGIQAIQNEILEPAITACPHASEVIFLAGDLMMRYDHFQTAIKYFQQGLQMTPENSTAYDKIANCYRLLAEKTDDQSRRFQYIAEAREYSRRLRDTSKEHYAEAVTRIYHDNSRLPTPMELQK
jgi:tetratricopeptide (TPR) repeat protein